MTTGQQKVEHDADRATEMIINSEPTSLEAAVRRAYLLGRTDQAMENLDNVLAHVRGEK